MYQKITQEAEGQLFGWFGAIDHTGDAQRDFDVLNDYTVYLYDGVYVAEYVPTGLAYGTYSTVEEALDCIKEKILEKQEAEKKIAEATEKFDVVVENNSLEKRYKDVNPEKKVKKVKTMGYIENLQNKARIRTEEMADEVKEDQAMKYIQQENENYIERLVHH